ncbi:hypothetical protein JW905_05280, partial [bacterium]|nr:hypothetical protein [candidate division CSSED10-310 bacterium]
MEHNRRTIGTRGIVLSAMAAGLFSALFIPAATILLHPAFPHSVSGMLLGVPMLFLITVHLIRAEIRHKRLLATAAAAVTCHFLASIILFRADAVDLVQWPLILARGPVRTAIDLLTVMAYFFFAEACCELMYGCIRARGRECRPTRLINRGLLVLGIAAAHIHLFSPALPLAVLSRLPQFGITILALLVTSAKPSAPDIDKESRVIWQALAWLFLLAEFGAVLPGFRIPPLIPRLAPLHGYFLIATDLLAMILVLGFTIRQVQARCRSTAECREETAGTRAVKKELIQGPLALILTDTNNHILFVSRAMEVLSGISAGTWRLNRLFNLMAVETSLKSFSSMLPTDWDSAAMVAFFGEKGKEQRALAWFKQLGAGASDVRLWLFEAAPGIGIDLQELLGSWLGHSLARAVVRGLMTGLIKTRPLLQECLVNALGIPGIRAVGLMERRDNEYRLLAALHARELGRDKENVLLSDPPYTPGSRPTMRVLKHPPVICGQDFLSLDEGGVLPIHYLEPMGTEPCRWLVRTLSTTRYHILMGVDPHLPVSELSILRSVDGFAHIASLAVRRTQPAAAMMDSLGLLGELLAIPSHTISMDGPAKSIETHLFLAKRPLQANDLFLCTLADGQMIASSGTADGTSQPPRQIKRLCRE